MIFILISNPFLCRDFGFDLQIRLQRIFPITDCIVLYCLCGE